MSVSLEFSLYAWYKDTVADAKNKEDIVTKTKIVMDRNIAFKTFLNTNKILPPYKKIPIEKLTQFSKENHVYVIAIISSTGETTLIENGIINSFPDEDCARISCGLKRPRSLLVRMVT